MKYFYSSIIISILGLIIAYFLGGFGAVYIVALLAILEISLSFDNAVVNAKILDKMSPIWQKRFIVFGIPVAVFGMRFLFPIIIVALALGLGLFETFKLAVYEPMKYQEALKSHEDIIYSFGGIFLLMVFLDFLFEKKEFCWIKILEQNFIVNLLSRIKFASFFISLAVSLGVYLAVDKMQVLYACLIAQFLHVSLSFVNSSMNKEQLKGGLAGFLYLEMLDVSFSFDGVIGAFALSGNIFIIMIGLGIGAFAVRSLTLFLVHKKTLGQYVYLEHGAHYAICVLALIMLAELFIHVSEFITGSLGIAFIILSLASSLAYRRHANR